MKRFVLACTRLLSFLALATQITLWSGGPAAAAPGAVIADVIVPEGAAFAVSVAFDGRYLYYTDFNGAVLHRIDVPPPCGNPCVATPAAGHVDYPILGLGGLGWGVLTAVGVNALSYDAGRDKLWAVGGDGVSVYLMSKTGAANLVFTIDALDRPGSCKQNRCLPLVDGLNYDRSDDTLWYKPDSSPRLYHYHATPDLLGGAMLVEATPWVDVDIAPNDIAAQCGPSAIPAGVAVGGASLFVGADPCDFYFEYSKTGTKLGWQPYDSQRAQDFECDNLSYGVSVLWARSLTDGHIRAYEQPSASACRFGGG